MISKEIEQLANEKLLEVEKNISDEFVSFHILSNERRYEVSANWNGYKWVIYNIIEISYE